MSCITFGPKKIQVRKSMSRTSKQLLLKQIRFHRAKCQLRLVSVTNSDKLRVFVVRHHRTQRVASHCCCCHFIPFFTYSVWVMSFSKISLIQKKQNTLMTKILKCKTKLRLNWKENSIALNVQRLLHVYKIFWQG